MRKTFHPMPKRITIHLKNMVSNAKRTIRRENIVCCNAKKCYSTLKRVILCEFKRVIQCELSLSNPSMCYLTQKRVNQRKTLSTMQKRVIHAKTCYSMQQHVTQRENVLQTRKRVKC